MQQQKYYIRRAAIGAAFFLFCLSFAGTGQAAELVTGRYLNKTGTRFVLEISVASSAPVNLIVIQKVPPGSGVVMADPAFKKYNRKKGAMRWLLRNVSSGRHQVRFELKQPVSPDSVRAEIRCKNPVNRQLMTIRVQ